MNKEDQEESKFKNIQNAEHNYKYFQDNIHILKNKISAKIHNGRYENLTDPNTNLTEALWTVVEPIYATFSLVDKNNNIMAVPLSFHIDTQEFEKKLNHLLCKKVETHKSWQSLY